ncbi:MAG: PolC-type DNA polymerase III [Bacilli bacterium]|nr:PolC-type DNA polymerase III [Bacilli bacterium]MBN2877771.1 PolC-type DNA polymerase III [Bacilli bacterium]
MNYIDVLLEKLQLEDAIIKEYCKVSNLEVDELSETWKFDLVFSQTIPILHYRNFISYLKRISSFIPSVKEVEYQTTFEDIDPEMILDYYDFAIDIILDSNKRILPLKEYETDLEDKTIKIFVPQGAISASIFREEIENEMKKNGFSCSLEIIVDEQQETIDESIQNDINTFVEANRIDFDETIEYISLTNGGEINNFSPIKEIPLTEMELEEYKERHGGKAIISVQGIVVYSEFIENKNSGIVKLVVTDGEDSIFLTKKNLRSADLDFYKQIENNHGIKAKCYAQYDTFQQEVVLVPIAIARSNKPIKTDQRTDDAPKKRVELHLHTKMSAMDGVNDIMDYLNRAKEWGHTAIGVSDHGSVQTFPELFNKTRGGSVKPLYGVEMTFVDDENIYITRGESNLLLSEATYVVFDIETTGLSVTYDTLIEIAGVKVKNGAILSKFSEFVDPLRDISSFTENLTGISNQMVRGKRVLKEVLKDFHEFTKDCILVAHNADFDLGFLYYNYRNLGITNQVNPSIDTLVLAKVLLPTKKQFSLARLAKEFKVPLDNHHRAINDAEATTEVFLHLLKRVKKQGFNRFKDMNLMIQHDEVYKYPYPTHINLLVQEQVGLKNLYRLLSEGLTTYYDRGDAKLLKSKLQKYRKGLLVSSGCYNSHFFEIAMNKTRKELVEVAKFYDYLEVQPPSYFIYLSDENPNWKNMIQDVIKRVVEVGKELQIPVVATGDVHHLDSRDMKYREIMINTPVVGGGLHPLYYRKNKPNQYFMTTEEMLVEFAFLGTDTAMEIVVENSNKIAESVEDITIIPDELFAPTDEFLAEKGIPSIKTKVEKMVQEKVRSIYGDPLPEIVKRRVDRELSNIIEHQFSTVYFISHLLVNKSLEDGYLVGSRGSVGSSLVATLMDITEVNPLPPHYVCPKCHFSAFKKTADEKMAMGENDFEKANAQVFENTDCGWDLPKAKCPVCSTEMVKDGHDIPFETFLGFEGDKIPDIDLNFSGEYQSIVHEYIRELFGKNHAFRAGTIGTSAARTSFLMVRDFYDKINEKRREKGLEPIRIRRAEMERLARGIEGSKRSSGQHPGGIVVVPNTNEIYDFTPVQYPGTATDTSWKTTHFDYHSIEKNLFKLDVLGHDDPTMIRYLMDLVRENQSEFPFQDAKSIPVDDPDVYKLLSSIDIIDLKKEDLNSEVASFGIPEFGTNFVRGMLTESRPKSFAELVKISGLSHGTDVWIGNSQTLVSGSNKSYAKVEFKDIIGCRDDIMVDLIDFGLEPTVAFEIMEFVRKGKAGKNPDKWASYADVMRNSRVPEWYIWSCSKIQYMFPKAHATAYVLMAMRIAWFKLYRPIYFYAAYFSKRASLFDADALYNNYEGISRKIREIKDMGNSATDREQNLLTVLEVALEMVKRGFNFKPIDLYKSDSKNFVIDEDKKSLILPFIVVDSLGTNVAETIIQAREEKPFISKQDVKNRTKLSSTLFTRLEELGTFDGMIEKNQMSLFDL